MLTITHPGKIGDFLWALPTARRLAQLHHERRVHFWLAPGLAPVLPLLQKQSWVGDVVLDASWQVRDTAPATPATPGVQEVLGTWYHLGYDQWPTKPLPFYTWSRFIDEPFAIDGPWLESQPFPVNEQETLRYDVLFHWTDRWFELKYGLTELIELGMGLEISTRRRCAPNSRWEREAKTKAMPLDKLAQYICSARVVVTDCSAGHVLATALGKPTVVVEPESDRHHFIFWPGTGMMTKEAGKWTPADNVFGQLIHPVLGNDGRPTMDARHLRDTIEEVLRG